MATDTIELPGVGGVDKKWVYAGGAVVVGVAGYAWLRARNAPAAVLPGVDTFPEAGAGGPTGYQNPNPQAPVGDGSANTAPVNNVEWATRAVDALGGIGIDMISTASAIGKYLARLPLSAQEQDWIRQAIALVGRPPEGTFVIIPPPTTPPPTTPPPSTAWKGPVLRKHNPGGPTVSIKSTGTGGRWTWEQMVPMFYSNPPPAGPKLTAAATALRRANAWRLPFQGTFKWATYPANTAVSVPGQLNIY